MFFVSIIIVSIIIVSIYCYALGIVPTDYYGHVWSGSRTGVHIFQDSPENDM